MNKRQNAAIWAQLIITSATLLLVGWIAMEMLGVA